jgi:hypothetical protein
MVNLFNGFLSIFGAIISGSNGYIAYNNFMVSKNKYISDIVADSVYYSYINYVKDKKGTKLWDSSAKKEAVKLAAGYFYENSYYSIPINRLERLINYEIIKIKATKSGSDNKLN